MATNPALQKKLRKARRDDLRDRLKAARASVKMTQSELAECMDRPQSFISKLEAGERRLEVVDFLEICEALKIDGPALLSNI